MARDQATAAAGALRRGEFVQDASIDPAASSDDRLIALLAYISQIFVPAIMPVIILLSESSKKRPFQRYHAVQALALSAVFVVAGVAAVMGTVVAQIVPFVGGMFALAVACLSPVAFLMYVIAMLYYGYQSYQGKRLPFPSASPASCVTKDGLPRKWGGADQRLIPARGKSPPISLMAAPRPDGRFCLSSRF
ncbi:MAG: hypothetical protein R2838_23170 [Caldilineaceae bacterium]